MKVAIVYDRINKFGGAERVLLTLHKMFPKAPLYTSVYSKEDAVWAKIFPKIVTSFLQKVPFAKKNHEFFFFLMPFVFRLFNFDEYDLVISVTSEFAKNINVKGKHICYCLTPTRYLWSGYDEYFNNKFLKLTTKPLVSYLRQIDMRAAKKPDEMVAISTVVQDRIKKFYKRKARIIFPPATSIQVSKTNSFGSKELVGNHAFYKDLNDYYLVVSRLVKYKKVNLAIEAFNELGSPLVIIGTGREERNLKKLAKKNIYLSGNIDDLELASVYRSSKALIFPQNEDFGIVSVEAQSFGIPVIAYKDGGSVDTVTKKTGVFFEKQNKESLIKAVKKFEKMKFNKRIIIKNAQRFSEDKFKEEFLKLAKSLVA